MLVLGGLVGFAAPALVSAHQLTGRFTSPIPLGAYLLGAAFAVGASFAVVFLRGAGPSAATALTASAATALTASAATAPTEPNAATARGTDRVVRVPLLLRRAITAVGVVAWGWIVLQAVILGGHSEGDVASLFLWTYGWVGLALVSAFIGPVWTWLDPFSSLHRLAAAAASRVGLSGGAPAPYPARLGRWPAVFGFAVVIWLELAIPASRSGQGLGLILLGYSVVTLVAMAQFGRDTWRRQGEVFTVWFGLIGRLAPLALPHPAAPGSATGFSAAPGRLRVRSFATGLLEADHQPASLVMVALSIGGILYDGLSQTQVFFDIFGVPTIIQQSLLLLGWLAIVVGIALLVARIVGFAALTAGLVPIAVGYLIAHYLTFILFDSQRILLALSDPLGVGSDLLGLAEFEPGTSWLPGSVAWSLQLFAVVGGHVIGAWAGHAVSVRERIRREALAGARPGRDVRLREIPLALLMVGLTTLTLWSLGQSIVTQSAAPAAMTDVLRDGDRNAAAPPLELTP
jgi:hypothetical protein